MSFSKHVARLTLQQKQIDALTAGLQKVSGLVETRRTAPQVVNNPLKPRQGPPRARARATSTDGQIPPTTKITVNSKVLKFARELNRVTSNLERLLLLRRLVSLNYSRNARGQLGR